jgi:hypothetical protein
MATRMCWRLVGLTAGLVLLGASPAWAAHVGGTYEGTLSNGSVVSFRVVASPTPVPGVPSTEAFVQGFHAAPPPLGKTELGQDCRIWEPPPAPTQSLIPIVDHAFSDTTPSYMASGSFTDPASASGTHRIVTAAWSPTSGGAPLGTLCDTGTLNWTASCVRPTPVDLCLPADLAPLPISAPPTFTASGSPAKVSRGGRVTLPLTIGCPPPGLDCRVSVSANANVRAGAAARRKEVKLGRAVYLVKLGSSEAARFRLTRKARALLRRLRRLKAVVDISVNRSGNVTTRILTVRLKAPRRPARRRPA